MSKIETFGAVSSVARWFAMGAMVFVAACSGGSDDDSSPGASGGTAGSAGSAGTTSGGAPTDEMFHAQSMAVGVATGCAVTTDGAVLCWGANSSGTLGNGSSDKKSDVPVQVTGLTSGATSVGVWDTFVCAAVNGGVQCWGDNTFGQLGDGTTTDSNVPVAVGGLPDTVTAVAVGEYTPCALTADGDVYCWGGYQTLGRQATGTSAVRVEGISGATALTASGFDECALLDDGSIQCFDPGGSPPAAVQGLPVPIVQLGTGAMGHCAIGDNGKLYCWDLPVAALGGSDTADANTAFEMPGFDGATGVAVGFGAACVITSTGDPACWGANNFQQLDTTSITQSSTPVAIHGVDAPATAVVMSEYAACVVTATGGIECWGLNTGGVRGNPDAKPGTLGPKHVVGF
jgi:alpha-tubulin suppressor-like RCC1 family protein